MSDRVYNVLRDIAQVYLPAMGVAYVALATIWGLPNAEQVSGTVLAIDTALGTILKLSSASYRSSRLYDGEFATIDTEEGTGLRLTSIDEQALIHKSELLFKIRRN